MNKELEFLEISTNLDFFFCGFIIADTEEELTNALSELGENVVHITDCDSVEKVMEVKNRVMNGEKIILSNLSPLYEVFSEGDKENHDGIYQFYQRFTEVYRDNLWLSQRGQIYFTLSKEEEEQFYNPGPMRDNHFRTMVMKTFDLTKQKTYRKEGKNVNNQLPK